MDNIIMLIDVDEWEEKTTFGTCELCEWEGTAFYQDLIFRQNNEEFKMKMYEWDWGDFDDTSINIKDIIPFAEFNKNKKITDREYLKDNIHKLHEEFEITQR